MRSIGILSVILAAVLWGTTGTLQTLLPEGREPLAVGAIRLLVGALFLLALAAASPAARRAARHLPWRGVLFAGVAIAGYNLLFFRAVSEAGVGIGTAVTIGSAPIWTAAYEALALRVRPGPARLAGQAVSIGGVALLGLSGGVAGSSLTGILLALGSGACYAAYSLATSRVGGRVPSVTLAASTFSVAALVTLPALVILPLDWIAGSADIATLLFLGVGATGLSYVFYTWGLTRVMASTAVTLALAEPVTAWLLATLLVGEPVTLRTTFGVAMILAGLLIVSLTPASVPRRIR
ncbi:DMT family transporter [Pelagovum pacificum]|uniref:DMT family transporter n=1 Tax=Pelagovum pacificum TaxID=2588711 RepID=UPI001E486962|nr:DMT family transporter [Pelagovum pacificum]